MRNPLADKIVDIKPSGIRKFFDIVNEMEDAISLGVGEPDFDTPWHIRDEGIYSLEKGRTFYTSNAGLKELRKEISNYVERSQGVHYDEMHEILVTVGGSEAIDLALRAMINPGEEVLIPQPSYVSYEPCAVLADAVPVIIELKEENEFRLTAQELRDAITDKTKILILPFPNNPTGAIMEKKDLEEIAEIIREKDIFVITDEIYAELSYKKKHVSIISLPGMRERTVYINGFSKAYAMTGLRSGYCSSNSEIIDEILKVHQYNVACVDTATQKACTTALTSSQQCVNDMRNEFEKRRNLVVESLNNMGLECSNPDGAFYVFFHAGNSQEFIEKALTEDVILVPGLAFGSMGREYVRLSYAQSYKNLEKAMKRLEKVVV